MDMSKGNRFGKKQKHGKSRATYFATAEKSIAANKKRRIAADVKRKEKDAAKRQAKTQIALQA